MKCNHNADDDTVNVQMMVQKYYRNLGIHICIPGPLLYNYWNKWHDMPGNITVKILICWGNLGAFQNQIQQWLSSQQ
jgi:hypothetical protein